MDWHGFSRCVGAFRHDFHRNSIRICFCYKSYKNKQIGDFENNYTIKTHVLEIASRVCDVQYCTAFLNAVAVPYMGIMLAQNH